MKHLLTIEELPGSRIESLVDLGARLKAERKDRAFAPLEGQCWGMIFSKSSTRTRVSFEVGLRELGGTVFFLSAQELQLGRGEPIEDTARVLGRMIDGAIIRTYAQQDVVTFADMSGIPTVNALTDDEHPCQILADLLTIREKLGTWEKKKIVFLGDADCNVARSWMWASERLGFELVLAAPEEFQPTAGYLSRFEKEIVCSTDANRAADGADVLYTDVWVSMGKEEESAQRTELMAPFQINEQLLARARPGAAVMHCLPAYRGKEITADVLEAHAETIFQQAENRLHAQKAVLVQLAESGE